MRIIRIDDGHDLRLAEYAGVRQPALLSAAGLLIAEGRFVVRRLLESTRVVTDTGTIAGSAIVPFLTEALEGLDVNSPRDWAWAEELAREQPEALPKVDAPPYA